MRNHILSFLICSCAAGCVIATDTVPGPRGEAGLSPFAYADDSLTDIYYDGGDVGLGTADAAGKQLHVAGLARFTADGPKQVESIEVLNGNAQKEDEPSVVFMGRTEGLAIYRLGSIGGIVEENTGFVRRGGLVFRTVNNEGSGDEVLSEAMRIDSEGRVGIGTATPGVALEVQGSVRVNDSLYVNGKCLAGTNEGCPDVSCVTQGCPAAPSDGRLKTNITPVSDALSRLMRLRGVTYDWIEPEKHGNRTGPQTGMIAQEVAEVFPDWVGTGKDGFKTLTIRGFEALAVEALRELKSENDALRREVTGLTAKAERTAKLEADLAVERAAREKLEARLAAIEAKLSPSAQGTSGRPSR